MLGDKEKNVRVSAEECLSNFKKEITDRFSDGRAVSSSLEGTVDSLLSILVRISKGKSASLTKLETLAWFEMFFGLLRGEINRKQEGPFRKAIV